MTHHKIAACLTLLAVIGIASSSFATTVLEALVAKAKRGDPHAQFSVGAAYEFGTGGVARDFSHAAQWYEKAANAGYAPAQSALGFLHQTGSGVARDQAAAVSLYHKAAEAGHARGQFLLALAHFNGAGVAKDAKRAAKWFHEAAKAGHQESQFILATMLHAGSGVKQNVFAARRWFDAANRGPNTKIAAQAGKLRDRIDARVNYTPLSREEWIALGLAGLGLLALAGNSDAGASKTDDRHAREAEFYRRCSLYWEMQLARVSTTITGLPPPGC